MFIFDFECYHGNADTKPACNAKELLTLMDEGGVDMAVAHPWAVFQPHNEYFAGQIRGHKRFIGACNPNPILGRAACEELERAVKEWGLRSCKLMPAIGGYSISDKAVVYPLMEVIRDLGIPVNIHSGPHNCHPLRIMLVAQDFPTVTVIMDHMGFRQWVEDAMAAAEKCDNIILGTTVAHVEPWRIRRAVDRVGAERVVFGTNAPHCIPLFAVENMKLALKDHELEQVMGLNLARIYGIEPKEYAPKTADRGSLGRCTFLPI